jgi:CRP-like cAMP-binding protein
MRGERAAEEHQRYDYLRTVPLLSRCSDDELRRIDSLGTDIRIPEGRRLMREDTQGFECVIILDGSVDVSRDGETIAQLGAGSVVGEAALIGAGRRNATVTTSSPTRALVLNSAEFDELGRQLPVIRDALMKLAQTRGTPEHEPAG